jgi:hypothetical protein
MISYCLGKWRDIIRFGGECELCGRDDIRLNGHHIIKRGWRLLAGWFLLENGICVCWKCHQNIHSQHNPTEQLYHQKILEYLEKKGINYELLYLQCRERIKDLGLTKLYLKTYLADLKKEK